MAKRPRILFPGAFYHVYNRGNDRHPVFRDDEDRMKYIWYLTRYAREMSVMLKTYCLLTNHFHLFIQTLLANLPRFMHRLHSAYAMWYNKKRGRTGHLYTSRYQASLVQEGNYALELSRYIHLNPVKANLVNLPEEWAWSGYGHYSGMKQIPFLDSTMILDQFGPDRGAQRSAYRRFVLEGLNKGTAWNEPPVKAGLFLGDDAFIEEICKKYGPVDTKPLSWLEPSEAGPSVSEVMNLILNESGLSFETLKQSKKHNHTRWRNMFIYLSRKLADAPLKQLSQLLDLSPAEISRLKYRFEEKALMDKDLSSRIQEIVSCLRVSAAGEM